MIEDLHQLITITHAIQREIDTLTAPTRPSPRLRRGRPLIKLRIAAATEAEAERARLLLEQLLASLSCRMQPVRAGRNPKYAEAPAWLSYGEFELPPSARRPTDS